jgi:hypothetical protein
MASGRAEAESPTVRSRRPHLPILLGCVLLAAATACDSSHHERRADQVIVTRLATVPFPKTLPPRVCFVGVFDYDVTLFAQAGHRTRVCERMADRYFPHTAHLPWAPSRVENADLVSECDLSRHGVRLSVSRGDPDFEGPRFDRAYDTSERVCAALRARGWRKTRDG